MSQNKVEVDWNQMITHFRREEFLCPCCGKADMDESLVLALDDTRDHCDFPFIVTSGYRCPDYNKSLKNSSPTSKHMLGLAADISSKNLSGKQIYVLIERALLHFRGVGIYEESIHLDLRSNREVAFWWGSY